MKHVYLLTFLATATANSVALRHTTVSYTFPWLGITWPANRKIKLVQESIIRIELNQSKCNSSQRRCGCKLMQRDARTIILVVLHPFSTHSFKSCTNNLSRWKRYSLKSGELTFTERKDKIRKNLPPVGLRVIYFLTS